MQQEEIYISVDVECSGRNRPGYYSMLSVGACDVYDIANKFYVEIRPLNDNFEPESLAVCGLDMEQLKKFGTPPEKAMKKFAAWVKEVSGDKKPIFVAFFAPFDHMFVDWYFATFLGKNPFANAVLCAKAYYMGLTGKMWQESSKSQLIFNTDYPHTHNALDDAIEQAELFRQMLEYQKLIRRP